VNRQTRSARQAYETANRKIDQAGSLEKPRSSGEKRMPARRPQVFADMSPAASVGLTAAWSGAVAGLLLIMILLRLFS
jgi:hypothetical protein